MALDGLRDRWERMARRERMLIVLLGVTFVVCLIGWVGFTVSDGLDAIAKDNDRSRDALGALEQFRAGKAGKAGDAAEVKIPSTPLSLRTYVDGIVHEVGIESPAYPAPKETAHGKFTESSFHLTLKEMTIYQLKDLFEKLERNSAVVVLKEIKVKRNFRDKEKLDVELTIATFYEPGAAPAAPEAADKDEKKEQG
jgi:hypothetical protein